MGFWGTLGKIATGIVDVVPKAVRGLGRLARGKFGEAAGDFGAALGNAALPVSFINPAVGTALSGLSGGLNALAPKGQEMLQPGNMGYIPPEDLVVPISGGLTNPRGPGAAMQPQGQSTLGKIGGFLKSPGGIAALAGLAGILDARSKRKAQQKMDQQKLDMLMAALTKSEKRQDMMDPAYGQSLANILGSLQDPGFLNQQLR